jgi:hypothetical protein
MAKSKKMADKFSNVARVSVTMSAAQTLTFNELNTGIAIFDKAAWIIHRIEYYFGVSTVNEMTADGDYLVVGLSTNNSITSIATTLPQVIDMVRLYRHDFGAAASGSLLVQPLVRSFEDLPGGGLIVPGDKLYLGMDTVGLANAGFCEARIRFSYMQLSQADYWELVESTRVIQ